MPSVLTYWRYPDEEAPFLAYLARTGDILACVGGPVTDPALVEPRPLMELIEREQPARILFTLREYMSLSESTACLNDDRMIYGRNYGDAPLIDYSRRDFPERRKIERANLAFTSSCFIYDGANLDLAYHEPQPPEFLAWARRIFAWIRRHTQPHLYPGQRITARIAAAVENGLELVP